MSAEAVSILHGSQFYVENDARWLRLRLRPFIADVVRKTRDSGRFGDSVLAALERDPGLEQFFDIGDPERTFGLRERFLFPNGNATLDGLRFRREGQNEMGKTALTASMIPHVAALFNLCGTGAFTEAQIRKRLEDPVRPLFDKFVAAGSVGRSGPKVPFAAAPTPAIYRLQHASILFRSATAGVVIDPHFHSEFERGSVKTSVRRQDVEGRIDAVLLSHSHTDHYSLSTLAMFSRDTPIIVPKVPRSSLLCESMKERLESLGFTRVIAPEWYSEPIVIGDIEIFALPFYGEQPLAQGPAKHPDLRNWGNTYLVRTPQYTSWVLIDSGDDDKGTTLEVAAHVRDKFGGVDFLLSNLRSFFLFSPFYITGAGDYWLSLPTPYMRKFHELRAMSVTLGAEGVAQVCRAARARRFLPYAHLFRELGSQGEDERQLVGKLSEAMTEIECSTQIVPWTIGEGLSVGAGGRTRRMPPPI